MSFGHRHSVHGQGIEDYYENLESHWPGMGISSYVNIDHPYCTAAFPATSVLTPISLPDTSFAQTRPSPVLSHHSQEYQHSLGDSIPQHGLGITLPHQGYPRTVTTGIGYPSEVMEYGPNEGADSPQPPPSKRARRSRKQPPPARETPVSILPNPAGLQRLEQERRGGQTDSDSQWQRPRAPGRGRKDPKAEEEDGFVERLREQNYAWKVIREMFREKYNKDASEARLQMRLSRRRKERLARWDENDIRLLIRARDSWEREKYQFIAQKMKELGSRKAYTAQQCKAQLHVLDEQKRGEERDPSAFVPPSRIPDPHEYSRARQRATTPRSYAPRATVSGTGA